MSEGFNARIAELYQPKILYVVRIGYYNNKEDADEVRNKIKSKLDIETIIIKNK